MRSLFFKIFVWFWLADMALVAVLMMIASGDAFAPQNMHAHLGGMLAAYGTGLSGQLMNVGSFIFKFQLTGGAFISGMIAAILIGALGGLLPAWRASRVSVVDSLRAV